MVEEPKTSFFSYLKITVNTLHDLMLEKELFSKTKQDKKYNDINLHSFGSP